MANQPSRPLQWPLDISNSSLVPFDDKTLITFTRVCSPIMLAFTAAFTRVHSGEAPFRLSVNAQRNPSLMLRECCVIMNSAVIEFLYDVVLEYSINFFVFQYTNWIYSTVHQLFLYVFTFIWISNPYKWIGNRWRQEKSPKIWKNVLIHLWKRKAGIELASAKPIFPERPSTAIRHKRWHVQRQKVDMLPNS